jgi:hypothetical protein
MRLATFPRVAVLVVALMAFAGLLASSAPATPAAAHSSRTVAAICAKRSQHELSRHAGKSRASASSRRAVWRRCVRELKRSTTRGQRDHSAPTVAWQVPTAGATVSGKLQGPACQVAADDNRGVQRVVFRVDNTTLNTETAVPYNCTFDTTQVGDGTHTLTATAYDAAGNSRSASTNVVVANAETPAPEPPASDVTAPSVSWQVPTAGATVSGKIEGPACQVAANDDRGVQRVVFKVDNTTLNTETEVPYNCIFDTTKVGDGTHTLTATAFDAAGNSSSASRSVVVANNTVPAPPPSAGKLVIGIDGGYGDWSSAEMTYRAQLGAAVTRHEWSPGSAVNAQDALVLKAATQVHTRIHPLLGGNELGSATHYREWVVAFIRRYGVGGSFWAEHPELDASRYAMTTFELGNEPYFGGMSASLYADTVRPALEEVSRLNLPAKMILDSRIYGTDTSWMDTLYARIPNLNSLFYAFADHPYWYGHDPATVSPAGPFGRIGVLRRRMNEKGADSKPIFITEYGESTSSCGSECVSESAQAQHLREMLEAAISRPEWKIGMVSVFQLIDRGTNSTNRELGFGVLRQNGTQKPSYSFVREMMQQYRG